MTAAVQPQPVQEVSAEEMRLREALRPGSVIEVVPDPAALTARIAEAALEQTIGLYRAERGDTLATRAVEWECTLSTQARIDHDARTINVYRTGGIRITFEQETDTPRDAILTIEGSGALKDVGTPPKGGAAFECDLAAVVALRDGLDQIIRDAVALGIVPPITTDEELGAAIRAGYRYGGVPRREA